MERTNFTGNTARKVAGGLLLLASILLTACNGSSGGDSTTTPTPTPTPGTVTAIAAKMEVLVSSPDLASDGNTPVIVSARVKDANNVLLEGQTVVFSTTDNAQIAVQTGGLTDKTGTATANVTTGSDQSSRNITITATSGSVSQKVSIKVSGSKIALSGSTSLVLSKESPLTISLKDAKGKGVANQTVSLESALKNTFKVNGVEVSSVQTDSIGQATISYLASNAGNDAVTAKSLGETSTLAISISNNTFAFSPAVSSQSGVDFSKTPPEVNLGNQIALTLLYSIGGTAQPNAAISFNSTRGVANPASTTTDANGKATVLVTSTTAGPAQITATTSGISNSYEVEFIAITPRKIVVQPDAAVVRSGTSTAINATVRDANSNLVKNQIVNFSLSDSTGGKLSIGSGTTNSAGQTSTTYTAGNSTSAKDGVIITATVAGSPTVTSKTALTVGGKSLFIRLGTGNQIEDANPTQNITPYSLIVTDSAGNSIAGAQVTLTIIPVEYYKGRYTPTLDTDLDGKPDTWQWDPQQTQPTCPNEDLNLDGILDQNEDTNSSNFLEPGNVATVFDAQNASSNTVKTDETGSAFVKVLYAKNYASWARVKLQATTRVEGSEYTNFAEFTLPGLAKDYNDIKIAPPGRISPFGQASSCSNRY